MADDASPNCRFYVEIDHKRAAVFTELSGLQVEMEVQEYMEGGTNSFVHRLPGRTKVGNITLKRGMASSREFLEWYLRVARGDVDRRNVSVMMYDVRGTVLMQWDFISAYPVKWVGPQLTATGAAMAVETLELTHNGFQLGQAGGNGQ